MRSSSITVDGPAVGPPDADVGLVAGALLPHRRVADEQAGAQRRIPRHEEGAGEVLEQRVAQGSVLGLLGERRGQRAAEPRAQAGAHQAGEVGEVGGAVVPVEPQDLAGVGVDGHVDGEASRNRRMPAGIGDEVLPRHHRQDSTGETVGTGAVDRRGPAHRGGRPRGSGGCGALRAGTGLLHRRHPR
jgi:hypothetical protein